MKIIASLPTSAFSAIVVTSVNNDNVTSGYYYDGKISGLRCRMVHESTKGIYIMVYGRRYYLHDFTRTGR